jgi:hypothetical protein
VYLGGECQPANAAELALVGELHGRQLPHRRARKHNLAAAVGRRAAPLDAQIETVLDAEALQQPQRDGAKRVHLGCARR